MWILGVTDMSGSVMPNEWLGELSWRREKSFVSYKNVGDEQGSFRNGRCVDQILSLQIFVTKYLEKHKKQEAHC